MKKLSIVSLFMAAAVLSASAQMSVVKDAKKNFKVGDDISMFINAVTPGLNGADPTEQAEAYYTAGEICFKNHDNIMAMYQLTKSVTPEQATNMGKSLLQGYEYFLKAIETDKLPNAKGEVKPKFTSKITKAIKSHAENFQQSGVVLFNDAKDFNNASKAWDIYVALPDAEFLGKDKPAPLPKEIAGEICYYNALAKYQAENLKGAIESIEKALDYGYSDEGGQIYAYATDICGTLKDPELQCKFAQAGYEKTGNPIYMRVVINSYLEKDDYEGANKVIDDQLGKIDNDSVSAPFYLLKGIIVERTEKDEAKQIDEATKLYQTAVEKDPKYGAGFYNLGRLKFRKAENLDMSVPANISEAEYNKFMKETLIPIKLEAAQDLRTAYLLDETVAPDAINLLKSLSYGMNNAEAQQKVDAIVDELMNN